MYRGEMWAAIKSGCIAGTAMGVGIVLAGLADYDPSFEPTTWQDGYRMAFEASPGGLLVIALCVGLLVASPEITGARSVEWSGSE